MKRICKHCQYGRDLEKMRPATIGPNADGLWCSNSKSPNFMTAVAEEDTCQEFYRRGEKAPLAMRSAISMVKAVKKAMRGRRDS